MRLDFENIFQHVTSMENFRLKWRFKEKEFDDLPLQDLDQLKPLEDKGAKFVSDYIANTNLHNDFPFKKDLFTTIDRVKILEGNEKEIKKWLYQRGLSYEKLVFLSWNERDAMIVPWKLLIKYFDSFYYGASDDLTIIDQSLSWALLFFHEDEIYFGASEEFKPSNISEERDFIL